MAKAKAARIYVYFGASSARFMVKPTPRDLGVAASNHNCPMSWAKDTPQYERRNATLRFYLNHHE